MIFGPVVALPVRQFCRSVLVEDGAEHIRLLDCAVIGRVNLKFRVLWWWGRSTESLAPLILHHGVHFGTHEQVLRPRTSPIQHA